MRLSKEEIDAIKNVTRECAGADATVRLFGSRADDTKAGGDVDLMVECPSPIERPALLAATLSARLSRIMGGRKVDVLLAAPNLLDQAIHAAAREHGVFL